jgi:hypothetical protein
MRSIWKSKSTSSQTSLMDISEVARRADRALRHAAVPCARPRGVPDVSQAAEVGGLRGARSTAARAKPQAGQEESSGQAVSDIFATAIRRTPMFATGDCTFPPC